VTTTSRLALASPLPITAAGLVMGFLGVAVSPWLFGAIFLAGVVLIITGGALKVGCVSSSVR